MMRSLGESPAYPTRLQQVLWGVTMLLTLFLLFDGWSSYQVGTYGDDGSYVAATDSLLFEGNYGMFLDPGELEATQFPFVYPMMLAPFRAWFPQDLNALKIVSIVATLAFLSVLFWGWRYIGHGFSYWWGLALFAVVALSPVTILHGRTVMSEAVFMMFLMLLLFWAEYVLAHKPRGWGIVFGLVAVGTVYSRTVGWVFLVPVVGYLIWKMRAAVLPQLGAAAATSAVVLAVIVTTTTVQATDLLPQEYMSQLSAVLDGRVRSETLRAEMVAVAQNEPAPPPEFTWQDRAALMARSLLNHLDIADKLPYQLERAVEVTTDRIGMPFLRYVPILTGFLIALAGFVIWVRRAGLTLFLLVTPAYVLMLMIWVWNGARLIYPVQQQIFLAILLGGYAIVAWVVARLFRNNARVLAAVVTLLLVVWLGVWVWLDLRLAGTLLLPGDQIARAAVLQKHIPPDAVVMSTRAETDFMYSPQRFIEVPRIAMSVARVREYLLDHNVSYVVSIPGLEGGEGIDNLRIGKMKRFAIYTTPLIQSHALVELYSNIPDDVAIYRVDRELLATLELP